MFQALAGCEFPVMRLAYIHRFRTWFDLRDEIGIYIGVILGITEKKMETTGIIGIMLGLYWDNGKENGNYCLKSRV